MKDFEEEYSATCPNCNHSPLHGRDCLNLYCIDGTVDMHDLDPEFFPPNLIGECENCKGTGYNLWCPECGTDLEGNEEVVWDQDNFN